ncbi:MAG: sensor histidine kinase [Burkholderiales bacterium]
MTSVVMAGSGATERQNLQQAFAVFTEASEQLADAYRELQDQVARLTRELAVANGELRREFSEKQALAQRLGLLLAALPAGVVAIDGEGRVEEFNPAALGILGGPLLGLEWQQVAQRLEPAGVCGEWFAAPASQERPRRIRIEASARDAAGGHILLLHDVTELQRMHDELRRSQRLSAMGEMAARLAHQLRTPLATALLYGAHLTQPSLQNEVRAQFAEKMLARLRHLERLISDMLLFVRGETGVLEQLAVADVVAELRQVMEPQMTRHGLHFSVDGNGQAVTVMADHKALCGALVSLLENAIQVSPPGGKVTLSCDVQGQTLALRVRDEGCGIPFDLQARLFEPFFTTRKEGTGLGLAIAHGVAQSLGGTIEVTSAPGAGSEFVMRLPYGGRGDRYDDM